MTRDDLIERLRAKGIAGVDEVRVAYIESDGDISALPYQESVLRRIRQATAAEEEMKNTV